MPSIHRKKIYGLWISETYEKSIIVSLPELCTIDENQALINHEDDPLTLEIESVNIRMKYGEVPYSFGSHLIFKVREPKRTIKRR